MKTLFITMVIVLACAVTIIGCGTPAPAPAPAPTSTTAQPAAPAPKPAPTAAPAPAPTAAPTAKPTVTPKTGGIFRVIEPRGPTTTLGWFAEAGSTGGIAIYSAGLFEGLLRTDYYNNTTPLLASGWEIAPDLKSVKVTLKKAVKFHDGSDLNATSVKWNYDQQMAAKMSTVSGWTSVDVVDDYTIRINLSQYRNTILNSLSSMSMVSQKAFDAKGKEWLRWNPVGTGPFQFQSFERDVSVKCTKFSDYWDKGKPYLNGVETYFITDPMTKSAAFLAGSADATGGDLTKSEYDLTQKGYPLVKFYSGMVCLMPDSKNTDSPFANLKVRQALDYAIDRDALVKARGFGFQTPVYQFGIPGTKPYINNLAARTYNPDKAKQLLTEAGFPNGLKTRMICDNTSTDREAMVIIQGFLSKVGIDAQLDYIDFATYNTFRTTGWKNSFLAGAVGYDANMNSSIERYWMQGAAQFPSVNKPDDLQKLYLDSLYSKDFDPAKMSKIIQYLFDNVTVIPLYAISRGAVLQPYVHDTGFYTLQAWPAWTPAEAWMSK